MGVSSYSLNPAENTSVNGVDISENCAAAGLNDAIRAIMADIRAWTDQQGIDFPIAIDQGGTGAVSASAALAALGGLAATYRQLPQSTKSGDFTFDLTQGAGHVYYTGTGHTATVPANGTVAFPTGTTLTVVNNGSGALVIARAGSVVLKWAATGADANRSLAVGGMATLLKVAGDTWFITGAGLS
jgi:hypothetical protein